MRGEHWIAVTNQGLGQAVNPDDVLHEQGCHVGSNSGFGSRDEDCLFRQPVDDNEDSIVVLATWQICYLVEGHTRPRPGRDREGGQEAEWRMAHSLVALAGVAAHDIALHCSREARPLEVLLDEGLGPRHAVVPRQR